jgi:hypothetical protein
MLAVSANASAFSWEQPVKISDPPPESGHVVWGNDALGLDVIHSEMNAAGVVQAGWMTSNEAGNAPWRTMGATRAATGAWASPQLISGQFGSDTGSLWGIEVEPDGDAVAMLRGTNPAGSGTGLYLSRRPAGGAWTTPILASPNVQGYVGYEQSPPQMAVDGSGNVAVFYRLTTFGDAVTVRRADWDTDAPLTAPTDTPIHTSTGGTSVSVGGYVERDGVDMNDSGAGIAVIFDQDDGHTYATTKGSTGGWSALTKVTSTAGLGGGVAGVDANGNAHVILGGGTHEATKPAAGSWSSVTEIPIADWGPGGMPRSVYIGRDGRAIMTIARPTSTFDEWATMAYSGGSWADPVPVPVTELMWSGADIEVVIDSNGNEHVAWAGTQNVDDGLWATRRPAGGSFGTPQEIDQRAASNHLLDLDELLVDADGEPVVVYQKHSDLMSSRGGDFPRAAVTPTSVDFGSLEVGSPASTRTVTLSNTGDAVLDVSGVQLNGPFTHNNPDCFGDDLNPGESCEIQLSFQATDTAPKSGSLVFTHNAAGGPTTVTLTGSGHNPRGNPQLNSAELQFGTREIGTVFPEDGVQGLPATLTNAGPGPIHISSVAVPFPYEASNPVGCNNLTLPANHSCTIFVKFRPVHAEETVRTLSFLTDDLASPHQITLRGTGKPAPEGGGSSEPTPQQAGTSDAKEAANGLPNLIPASDFQKNGLKIPLNIDLANTQVNGQADGIIASGGGNLLGQAGTNIIASDGVSFVGQANVNNLLGQAGTNKLRAAQSSVTVKCPSKVLKKNKKAKCRRVILISGNVFLPLPGPATLTVRPTATFNKALKQAIAYAKAQRKKGKKGKKVAPFKLEFATIIRPGGPTAPGYYQPKALTIKP